MTIDKGAGVIPHPLPGYQNFAIAVRGVAAFTLSNCEIRGGSRGSHALRPTAHSISRHSPARKFLCVLENVGYGTILGWIKISRFKKDAEVRKKLSATWAEFPGIVPFLWRALEAAEAASAA